jgi:hypothetical protein
MWFDAKHLKIENPIYIENLHGYVLPHAATEFTGVIISHTLRFRPLKKIKKVIILYYPASAEPDIINTYYHEYYVPWQAMQLVFADKGYDYKGYNIQKGEMPVVDLTTTLIVVSADFSHFLPMQQAIALENKAARSLMFKEIKKEFANVVDHLETFKVLFDWLPETWQLQWVGRGRSAGLKAVGYLSFLLRETPPTSLTPTKPDGLFVTTYSNDMTARECQGIWFTQKKWSLLAETKLIKNVLTLGETTSRLTGGLYIEKPLTHYSITYLYKDRVNPFIRGWHGILHHAFYLPDVFLEHTFNNGKWITARDTSWPKGDKFDMTESLQRLREKAGLHGSGGGHFIKHMRSKRLLLSRLKKTYRKKGGQVPYTLYSTRVVHYIV